MSDERCWLCSFYKDDRCTNTFRLTIHVEPVDGIGGQVDFSTTPGMVPEELKSQLAQYMSKFFEKVLPVISTLPFWDQIRKYQMENPEAIDCPARKERKDLKPFLHVVKI